MIDVVWEGGCELEGFEEVGHAPSWVFEEEAQFDVRLGAEGVDQCGIHLVMPAHGLYDCNLERLLLGRFPLGREWRILRGRCHGFTKVARRSWFVENRVLYDNGRVLRFPPWFNEAFVVYGKKKQGCNNEESQR